MNHTIKLSNGKQLQLVEDPGDNTLTLYEVNSDGTYKAGIVVLTLSGIVVVTNSGDTVTDLVQNLAPQLAVDIDAPVEYPHNVWIMWGGSDQEDVVHYGFNTDEESCAFLDGIDEAIGWLDYEHFDTEEDANRACEERRKRREDDEEE